MNASYSSDGLYDIYDLWHKPFWQLRSFWLVFGCAVMLVVLACFCFFLFVYMRQKKKEAPWIWALRKLNGLQISTVSGRDEAKEFYFSLTLILRHYLSARYNLDLAGKTDQEIIYLIDRQKIPFNIASCVKAIFEGGAFVKYADESVLNDKIEQDLNRAINLVKSTGFIKINSPSEGR